jgi:enterochelin esterase-like enzyme
MAHPPGGRSAAAVRALVAAGDGPALLDLARSGRGPVVASTEDPETFEVTFVFTDPRRRPPRVGVFCPAVPGGFMLLSPLRGDVFAGVTRMPRGTRVRYHFCPDAPSEPDEAALFQLAHSPRARRLDPLNPGFEEMRLRGARDRMLDSLLTLPGAPAAPPLRPGAEPGQVETLTVHSRVLGEQRTCRIYRPPGYRPERGQYRLVLMPQTSYEWRRLSFLDHILGTGEVPGCLVVVVEERRFTGRFRVPLDGAAYARFIVDELLPVVSSHSAVVSPYIAAGYSAGAVVAASLCLDEPDLFDELVAISGGWHLRPGASMLRPDDSTSWMLARYRDASALPRRVFLSAGTFEDTWQSSIYPQTEELATVLAGRGVDVRLRTGPTGHDTVTARAYLAEGLTWLLTAGDGGTGDR